MLCDRRAFLLCAVSRCKALQGVLTPRLYSYTPAHFTQLCEPIRAPWAIIACLSRFTLCCELAGDRRSGERDAGGHIRQGGGMQTRESLRGTRGRETAGLPAARREGRRSMDGIRQPSNRPGCEPGSGYR